MGAVVLPQQNFLQNLLAAQQAVGGLQEIQQRAQQQRQLEALRQRLQSQQNLPTVLAQLATVSPQAAAQAREGLNLPFQQQGMQQQALLDAARAQNQLREFGAPLTREGRLVFESGFTSPEEFQAELRRRQASLEAGRTRPLVQNTILPQGNIPASRATQNQAQKSLLDSLELSGDLEGVSQLGDVSDLLTAPGRLATAAADLAINLGIPAKLAENRVQRDAQLQVRTGKVFNTFRRNITGAAAPEKELQELKKTVISTDLNSVRFATALKELQSATLRAIRLNRKVLLQGFDPGSDEGAAKLDRLWRSGDSGDSQADREKLKAQLVDNGLVRAKAQYDDLTEDELRELATLEAEQQLLRLGFPGGR